MTLFGKNYSIKNALLFTVIFSIALFFRLYDVNWDQNQHLHPDERFLTMVGNAMHVPNNFSEYENPQISLMNPYNIGNSFYVYGTFPVVVNKLISVSLGTDNYKDFTIQGRYLSAFVDLITFIFLFKTALLLEKKYHFDKKVKFFAIFLYAISTLPIQLSHFLAVDTFVNCFTFISFYFALSYFLHKRFGSVLVSGIFFGVALGCKISAIYTLPFILFLLISYKSKKYLLFSLMSIVFFFVAMYISLRIADPYLFETSNIFFPIPNHMFLSNIQQLQSFSTKDAMYPPAVQWINKTPVLFALTNIAFFGLGIPYFLLMTYGMFLTIKQHTKTVLTVCIGFVILFFLFQSLQFADTMRYFLFLYPFFALFAALGLQRIKTTHVALFCLIVIIIWPLMFFGIYTKPHSRVTASTWIYNNIPSSSLLLTESWDDGLPVTLDSLRMNQTYVSKSLPVFDPDTPEKWQTINALLKQGNYYILSSNRGWGSIPTVPDRYPKMSQFYNQLFAGKLQYKKVAEFSSYPTLSYLGIPITMPDQWSEEAFTVYDHPKVMIFKKE